jgi:hypothetical protein
VTTVRHQAHVIRVTNSVAGGYTAAAVAAVAAAAAAAAGLLQRNHWQQHTEGNNMVEKDTPWSQ